MELEMKDMLKEVEDTISGLSDLRYGRFGHSAAGGDELGDEVLAALQRLQDACASSAG